MTRREDGLGFPPKNPLRTLHKCARGQTDHYRQNRLKYYVGGAKKIAFRQVRGRVQTFHFAKVRPREWLAANARLGVHWRA